MQGGLRTIGVEKKSEVNFPLVTIITVVLNGEKYLEQTFKSVFNQSYSNIEYIVIDGGSKDNTIDIIEKYTNQIDFWQSEPDKGLYFAMNKGIGLAKGELIGILNADDYCTEDAVKLVVEAYLKTNADVFHGDILLLTDNESVKMKPDFSKMMQQPSVFHTQYKISADYDFLLRCIIHKYIFNYIPEVLCHFRPGGMSASCASNLEGYKIMKFHQTGYHKQVILRTIKCYLKTFVKKFIN